MGFWSDLGDIAKNPLTWLTGLQTGFEWLAGEKDREAQEVANMTNADTARAINAEQMKLARENMALQEVFAKQGVRWRVADAEAAGLHPLAALGASGASYNPVSSSAVFSEAQPVSTGAKWRALSNMGQNLSRAVLSTATQHERQMAAEQLRGARLQNDLVSTQLALSKLELARSASPAVPSFERDRIPYKSLMETQRGVRVMPSREFMERSMLIDRFYWWLENRMFPDQDLIRMERAK